ncbi:MAG: PIN domain-containing protein [Deltaproteobacteria bacterium]|nr:PIN domain-containing protein [Deltaproteobacteria bacterium]
MAEQILIDTGPIVAVLIAKDRYHYWAREQFSLLPPPLMTCEAVLSEAQFLVHNFGGASVTVLEMVEKGVLKLTFGVAAELDRLRKLQQTYRNVPMSLADACLVRMAELHPRSRVFTIDSDFRIYRRHGRQVIPVLMPPMR